MQNKSHKIKKFTNLHLIPMMQEYHVTVRVHSVSMATAKATSNGTIDGYIHSILPGIVTVTPYQSETTTLTCSSLGSLQVKCSYSVV